MLEYLSGCSTETGVQSRPMPHWAPGHGKSDKRKGPQMRAFGSIVRRGYAARFALGLLAFFLALAFAFSACLASLASTVLVALT